MLRNRFRKVELRPYSLEDLTEIIRRAAARDGLEVAPEAALVIAKASAGTARIAIGLYTEMRTLVDACAGGLGSRGPERARCSVRAGSRGALRGGGISAQGIRC